MVPFLPHHRGDAPVVSESALQDLLVVGALVFAESIV
jgi:hypothetical protein